MRRQSVSGVERKGIFRTLRRQLDLQLFAWIGIVYLIIFNFIPMFGIIIAFKDYSIASGVSGIFTSD